MPISHRVLLLLNPRFSYNRFGSLSPLRGLRFRTDKERHERGRECDRKLFGHQPPVRPDRIHCAAVQFARTGNPFLSADLFPNGKSHEWPLYDLENKVVMIFDEFNIHPEKESERKILDWERICFLTNYDCF